MNVEGMDKDGAAVTRNIPVLTGGVDGSGNVQTFAVGTDGGLLVTATGSGDAITVADGADVTQGATTDPSTANTVIGRLKNLLLRIPAGLGSATSANSFPVVVAFDQGNIPVSQATASALNVQIVGTVASGSADSGNPAKVGGKYNSTLPTFADGQRGDLQINTKGALFVAIGAASSLSDGLATQPRLMTDSANNSSALAVGVALYNGTSWDRQRTPNVFKTVTATGSGDTAVWTPTTGKKFRLLGYAVYVTANVTVAGGGLVEVLLRDSTTAIGIGYSLFAPATALATFAPSGASGQVQLGNGVLSATANNVLNVNLSATLATGEVRVSVWGTEE